MTLRKLSLIGPLCIASALALTGCNNSATVEEKTPSKTVSAPAPTIEATADNLNKPPRIFLRCRSCHAYEIGKKNAVGPNLVNVFGNPAGADVDYKFSQSLKDSEIIWDAKTLDAFLENPSKTIPGTKMAFVGLKKEEDRTTLIKWMETLNAEK